MRWKLCALNHWLLTCISYSKPTMCRSLMYAEEWQRLQTRVLAIVLNARGVESPPPPGQPSKGSSTFPASMLRLIVCHSYYTNSSCTWQFFSQCNVHSIFFALQARATSDRSRQLRRQDEAIQYSVHKKAYWKFYVSRENPNLPLRCKSKHRDATSWSWSQNERAGQLHSQKHTWSGSSEG